MYQRDSQLSCSCHLHEHWGIVLMCLQPWLEWRRSKLYWYVKWRISVLQNDIIQSINGKILLFKIELRIVNYICISLIPIHKTCSCCNLTYSPSAHCSEIFGQSSICVITDFFAESDFCRFSLEISSNNSICSTIMQKKNNFTPR